MNPVRWRPTAPLRRLLRRGPGDPHDHRTAARTHHSAAAWTPGSERTGIPRTEPPVSRARTVLNRAGNQVLRKAAVGGVVVCAAAFGACPAATAQPTGPDVSSWQHDSGRPIDWFAVRGAGHGFAMVKATEGLHYVNPYFVQDSLHMRVAGMARGTYHYAHPDLPPEPQAALYAAVVLGQNGPLDLPPVLDIEHSGGLPPAALIDWTHRYLNTVQALTGRVPIIYTYPTFWKTAMADSDQFHRYPLWIADYRDRPQPEVPGRWPAWTFWQQTDSGSIPGIHGPTDVNVYSGAQGDFGRFARMGGLTGSG